MWGRTTASSGSVVEAGRKQSLNREPEMSESLIVALVAAGSAVLGSAVTGWFTYISAARARDTERYKRRLVQAYSDIAAFYRLEERYTKALESDARTAESWKREVRRKLRDEGGNSPSEDATAQRAEQRIAELA
jgi:hypothetical protein